jgi:TPR repeat protein
MKHILTTLLLLTLAAPAWGQDWDKGSQAYMQGDYATALKELRPLAEQGDSISQTALGKIYYNGLGVTQNYAEAAKWLRLAAEQGSYVGQHLLGSMYRDGNGVTQDDAKAMKWWRLAAEQGYAKAQKQLGVMYLEGNGVPQDYVVAHMWFNLAVAQGAKEAVEARDAITNIMTSDQIAEAQRLAREWMAAFEKRKK